MPGWNVKDGGQVSTFDKKGIVGGIENKADKGVKKV